MRLLAIHVVATLLFAGLAAGGQSQEEARAILEKAIKAQGGAEYLSKYQAATIKIKGKLDLFGGIDISQELSFQMPNKFRDETSTEVNGMAFRNVAVSDGKTAALEVNGMKIPLSEKQAATFNELGAQVAAARLVPLRDKAFELTAVGEAQVNGKPAVGIRASKKGMADVTLYFDKTSYLVVKVEHRTLDFQSEQEMTQERIITEYTTVDGRPQPKKVLINRDGKKFLEAEILEVKDHEKLDDGLFKLP
jgi:hypothetical protein